MATQPFTPFTLCTLPWLGQTTSSSFLQFQQTDSRRTSQNNSYTGLPCPSPTGDPSRLPCRAPLYLQHQAISVGTHTKTLHKVIRPHVHTWLLTCLPMMSLSIPCNELAVIASLVYIPVSGMTSQNLRTAIGWKMFNFFLHYLTSGEI